MSATQFIVRIIALPLLDVCICWPINFILCFYQRWGQDSSVGIAVGYGLNAPEIESR
jgi:hypothetical protein